MVMRQGPSRGYSLQPKGFQFGVGALKVGHSDMVTGSTA